MRLQQYPARITFDACQGAHRQVSHASLACVHLRAASLSHGWARSNFRRANLPAGNYRMAVRDKPGSPRGGVLVVVMMVSTILTPGRATPSPVAAISPTTTMAAPPPPISASTGWPTYRAERAPSVIPAAARCRPGPAEWCRTPAARKRSPGSNPATAIPGDDRYDNVSSCVTRARICSP